MEGGEGTMGAGSGIVIDSDPAAEFRECLLKAKFLTAPPRRSTTQQQPGKMLRPDELLLIEAMLWNGAYPFLELHLDRLTDSAEYFDFACERTSVKSALLDYAATFTTRELRKVRLLLASDGAVEITNEVLPANGSASYIGRVRISIQRTDPADPMLYHKTTQRPIYAEAIQQAAQAGFDDVLFLNQRDEVTEGAISNVFIEKDGRWFTPPIKSGLLAGVFRRHLLETRRRIEERVLSLDDLRSADTVYITNAVRGLRRVDIDW
jgi:para-aminobenzoate synthetase/4-amino-4-deoxychorismate lyase